MSSRSRFARLMRVFRRFSEETRLCFGAGLGCVMIGGLGDLFHAGGSAGVALSAVKVIGGFYLFLGITNLLRKPESGSPPLETAAVRASRDSARSDSQSSSREKSQSAA